MMAAGLPPLRDILDHAGADTVVIDYIQARGITSLGTFAKVASSVDNLRATLIQPLLDGFKKGGAHLVVDDVDKPIIEAVIITAWEEAQALWAQHVRRSASASTAAPGSPAPATATTTLSDDRPPKQLPTGVWNNAIRKYNDLEIQGIHRKFPEKELLGAEVTLARMHHEHTRSKMYTPVGLGELMTHRSFTSTGEPNPLVKSKQEAKTTLTVEGDKLVQEADKVWQPKSVLAVIDAINSIRWAWILLDYGPELVIHEFCDWLSCRARLRPQSWSSSRSITIRSLGS